MNFENIPKAPTSVYPQNNAEKANFIENPFLPTTKDPWFVNQIKKLNDKILKEEILSTVKSFKINKNPGPGIHIRLILLVLYDIIDFLLWLYNLFWFSSYLPKIFKIRYIKPIIKPSKDPHILNNYRQISLFGYIGKIYEKIISIRLTKYVIDCGLINKNSMGFLQGKSAVDALSILSDDIYAGFDIKTPTYSVFFDIIGCYDAVQYDILSCRLNKYYGITGIILLNIQDLFADCWTRTIVNNIGSKWFLSVAGLGQGRPSSPILNLLFLDPLQQQKMEFSGTKTKFKIFYNNTIKRKYPDIIYPQKIYLNNITI